MATTEKKNEKFIDGMIEFIKGASDDERLGLVADIIFQAALWGSYNHYESLGLLEEVKRDLQAAMDDYICDDCRQKEEEEKKKTVIKGN
jgi:hypothetical protein